MTRGLIIGKFYPLHKGHEFLIRSALEHVDQLAVVVCALSSEEIPSEVRVGWVETLFPEVSVFALTDDLPQRPEDDPMFWAMWDAALHRVIEPASLPMHVFGSESYIPRLAECFEAEPVIVDLDRLTVPISGSQLRADPEAHAEFLSPIVRDYFARSSESAT